MLLIQISRIYTQKKKIYKMKKRKFLHTNFVKFVTEKYKEELQNIRDEAQEEIENEEDLIDEVQSQVQAQAQEEQEDEIQNEDEDDFDKLVREYKELEKKYNKRKNGGIHNKRK